MEGKYDFGKFHSSLRHFIYWHTFVPMNVLSGNRRINEVQVYIITAKKCRYSRPGISINYIFFPADFISMSPILHVDCFWVVIAEIRLELTSLIQAFCFQT